MTVKLIRRYLVSFLVSGMLIWCSSSANAALFSDDQARNEIVILRSQYDAKLTELKQKIAQLSDAIDQLDNGNNKKLLDVVGQLDPINQQIADLRGQIEVMNFNLQNIQKRQQDIYADLDARLRVVESEKPRASRTESMSDVKLPQEGQPETAHNDGNAAYEAAYALYRKGKLKRAADAFEKFIAKNPKSPLLPNAFFWMGMAQAQGGQAKAAIKTWRQLAKKYPKHAKTPDALKAIASVQLGQDQKAAAVKTLRELIGTYPQSDAALDAEKQLRRLK